MRHLTTVARKTALGVTILTAFILLASAACSNDKATPRPQPNLTKEALAEEIATLQQEAQKLRDLRVQEKVQPTLEPDDSIKPPTEAPETAAPLQTPAALTAVTPPGTGICWRSPEIQKALLYILQTHLCQLINDAELSDSRTLALQTTPCGSEQSGRETSKTW